MFKRGFTLIELLIVIAVISILIGIAVPRFLGMRDEGYTGKAAAEVHALQAAVEAYKIHIDAFPPAPASLGGAWQSALVAMRPQIIEKVLDDPFDTDTDNEYRFKTNGDYYVIWSEGADEEDDISDVCDDGKLKVAADKNVKEDIFVTNGSGETIVACP
ncbi:MAG: prepilin-type N-terminal cleavage/methylation domain-containing protein [Candidatus Omnitrophota bacterium]